MTYWFDAFLSCKVGCVFLMVVVFILHKAKFRPNDHREDAPHFKDPLVDFIYVFSKIVFEK